MGQRTMHLIGVIYSWEVGGASAQNLFECSLHIVRQGESLGSGLLNSKWRPQWDKKILNVIYWINNSFYLALIYVMLHVVLRFPMLDFCHNTFIQPSMICIISCFCGPLYMCMLFDLGKTVLLFSFRRLKCQTQLHFINELRWRGNIFVSSNLQPIFFQRLLSKSQALPLRRKTTKTEVSSLSVAL